MGSRFKDRELGEIKVDETGCAEEGAAGGVSCFDIGNFCESAGCWSASPNSVISSEATSGGEVSACLRAFCCGTFSLWLLLIVLLATKFESLVCEGGFMSIIFKDRELGEIKADERGVAEAGAAGGVSCFDVGSFCDGVGCDWPTSTVASPQKRRAAERQARVCGPSAAWKAGTGAAQQCPEGSRLARLRRR